MIKRLLATIAALPILASSAASAQQAAQISIPINTIKRGNPGSTHLLAEKSVADEFIGQNCAVQSVAMNQGSVHPGNDLIVASGNDEIILADVERESGVNTSANGNIVLGGTVSVTLKLGQDKVFSGGMNVTFTCEPVEEETTVICRDGEVITVAINEVVETDTNAPCVPEEETQEEPEQKPQVLAEVAELPKTGASSITAIMAGTFIAGTAVYSSYSTRKNQ